MAMRGFVLCIRDEVRRRSRAQGDDPSRLWAEKRGCRRALGLTPFLADADSRRPRCRGPRGSRQTHTSFPKKRAPPQGLSRIWGAGWATATLGMRPAPSTRPQGPRPSRLVCRPLKIFNGPNFAAPPRYRLGPRLFCSDMPAWPALCYGIAFGTVFVWPGA